MLLLYNYYIVSFFLRQKWNYKIVSHTFQPNLQYHDFILPVLPYLLLHTVILLSHSEHCLPLHSHILLFRTYLTDPQYYITWSQ